MGENKTLDELSAGANCPAARYSAGNEASSPPERKTNWNHSEKCLVWYDAEKAEGGALAKFGIAYYHYDPTFENARWVDHDNYGRQPDKWWPLPWAEKKR